MSQPNEARPSIEKRGMLSDGMPTWTLSPTDCTFLWDECKRCFHRKVRYKQPRPRSPFPKVFALVDRAMKDFYLGERADELVEGAPKGVIGAPDRWVKSVPLSLPGSSCRIVVRGRLDALVMCDDGTMGVLDFKTVEPRHDHVAAYGRQLQGYATALEHPSAGRAESVSNLGLLCFAPDRYEASERRAALSGEVTWIEVPRDDVAFDAFLGEVGRVLENPEPPDAADGCVWCRETLCGLAAA